MDAESGQRLTEDDYGDILAVFKNSDLPVLNAKRVAKHFGVPYQKIGYHLDKLSDRGELEREKFGPSVVYWLSGEERSC